MKAILYLTVPTVIAGLMACGKAEEEKDEEEVEGSSVQFVVSLADLPACNADSESKVFWVEEKATLKACRSGVYVDIKGEPGAKGDKGDTGESGATGAAGSPANSGVWLFDANNVARGLVLDGAGGIILFENGGVIALNLITGGIRSPVGLDAGGGGGGIVSAAECRFISNDCSGTCYLLDSGGTVNPMKGAIFNAPGGFKQATGTEILASALTFSSRYSDGSCQSTNFTSDAFPITAEYSLPPGLTLPLAAPLSFRIKTQ